MTPEQPRPQPAASLPDGPEPELEADENLLVVLRGIGSTMFLTDQRVIVARDGGERRPRSGIQSFWLDEIGGLRLELGSAPSGRIAISAVQGHEAISMFFDTRAIDRAHEMIDVARGVMARRRAQVRATKRVGSPRPR